MSIAEHLLPEFDQEMATTHKVLARVPSAKGPRGQLSVYLGPS